MAESGLKTALITGASGGIGSEMARCFSLNGVFVGIGYHHNRQKAIEIQRSIEAEGGKALAVYVDYCDRNSIRLGLESVKEEARAPVSILINNGAIAQEKPLDTISDEDWQVMLQTNLQGPFIASQEALPDMLKQKWGRIINIGSIGGQWGGFNQVHYAASKAALINFTQSLAKIYSGQGISSMCISIGLVATEMSANELSNEEGQQKVNSIPMLRLASAEEIAKIAWQLCQEHSAYLSGQTINVNGGMYFG